MIFRIVVLVHAFMLSFICIWLRPDGVLKMRKLQKLVLKALQESGVGDDDKSQLSEMLEHKIISNSRYTVENKYWLKTGFNGSSFVVDILEDGYVTIRTLSEAEA
ncbi:pre-mRNA cleavage factor Im 25 kDa subunit 1-like [Gossypium australe]|uniref:Pre-mRNA cleavage factor Im 25 kDa subunit 1-like n=1 Tax=Gossypium australe TaxID=47621 RepID=A0A5B6X9C1_9ROSI|nr:pre-mRNA cleavage factor Im 25 kDa subunit 1-like [Gossypium australe]